MRKIENETLKNVVTKPDPDNYLNEIEDDMTPSYDFEQENPDFENQCLICGECFETIDSLRLHKFNVHDKEMPSVENKFHL